MCAVEWLRVETERVWDVVPLEAVAWPEVFLCFTHWLRSDFAVVCAVTGERPATRIERRRQIKDPNFPDPVFQQSFRPVYVYFSRGAGASSSPVVAGLSRSTYLYGSIMQTGKTLSAARVRLPVHST